ncbi:MAG: hypothetical protein Q4E65_03225 [Clostridia bacterium]|nr:hypothetical protein [Clostridia bacterium]
MEHKKQETLEEILSEKREFDEEQAKAREAGTWRLFRILMICVVSLAAVMVILGLIYN